MIKKSLVTAGLCLLFGASAMAQLATTTSLVGNVTDSSGSAIPNAKVTAVEKNTSDTYAMTTNEQGYYSRDFVRVGVYDITVEQQGFQKVTKSGILVSINQNVRTDFALKVGELNQSVTVQAEATAIKTDDATVSETLNTRTVADLPLNGRNPMTLAVLTPGVLLGPKSNPNGNPPGMGFIGAGTREIQNSLALDGINISNNLITNSPTRPMVETIQEVEVQTGTYSAQYGAYLGVHINMVTKSGSNQIHGAFVEFLRNQKLDARQFFTLPTPTNPLAKKPPLRQNQFGVEFDGPVYIPKLYNGKDKTFFMASYEGFRLVQQSTSLSNHMPANFFDGNFSQVPTASITGGTIKDPFNANTPFPGNIIPTNRLSPAVQKLRQYYPASNLPGFASNLSVAVPQTNAYNQTGDRIDHNIGNNIRIFARAHWQSWNGFGGNQVPVNGTTTPTETINYSVGYTHTITPNLVNDLRCGQELLQHGHRQSFLDQRTDHRRHRPGNSGLQRRFDLRQSGHSRFQHHRLQRLRQRRHQLVSERQHQSALRSDQLEQGCSQHHGRPRIPAARHRRAAVNSARGIFNFNGTQTGYAPADFILGTPVSFGTAGPEIRGRVASWRDGFFVLDKWQVSRKLTLNYGIRYELPTVPYTINGNASILNPEQTQLIVATPGMKLIAPNHDNWAPRLGIAYRFNEKTVFRAGAGIYYNPNQTNSYTFLNTNPPWSPIFQCNWSAGLPTISLSNPFAVSAACPLPGSNSGALIVTPPGHQPTQRMNQWSASLQRQLWNGGGLEVQYLGSHAYHLDRSYYNNTRLPGPGRGQLAPPESALRTHPHDQQRSDRQLRKHVRHFPSAHCTWLANARELHVVAHAGRKYGFQRRRRSDESLLVEGRLRQCQLGHPPSPRALFHLRRFRSSPCRTRS
jgi:hypothetical protein